MENRWTEIEDWTAAYDNRAAVPTHEEFFYAWGRDAAAYRDARPPEEVVYGDGERERLDLFRPEGEAKGLAVFLHGGWWMFFGREYFSHLAAGAVSRGWAVAMPSYTLCPDIHISGIGSQVNRAVDVACAAVAQGPLVLAGHSAGGHLVALLGSVERGLQGAAAERLRRIVPISGIADLHPLMRTAMNENLRIDAAAAEAASPAFLTPRGGFDLIACAGGEELAEFRRQNALLAAAWGGRIAAQSIEAEGKNHFDVIAPLAEMDSALTRLVTLDQSG